MKTEVFVSLFLLEKKVAHFLGVKMNIRTSLNSKGGVSVVSEEMGPKVCRWLELEIGKVSKVLLIFVLKKNAT